MRENDAYKAIYCGLCKQLRKSCGPFSRLYLSYDITFMALIALSLKEECNVKNGRCMLNPMKKRRVVCEEPSLEYCARISALLTYYKLADDSADEKGFTALKARTARLLFHAAKKKATAALPIADSVIAESCEKLRAAEQEGGLSLDHYCDFFASMLGEIFMALSEDEGERRILREVGYFTGKWIYLLDAVDDLKEDFLKCRFNAILSAYGKTDKEDIDCYRTRMTPIIESYLDDCRAMLERAFELLPVKSARGIAENIIYLGMPDRQKSVVAGCKTVKNKELEK